MPMQFRHVPFFLSLPRYSPSSKTAKLPISKSTTPWPIWTTIAKAFPLLEVVASADAHLAVDRLADTVHAALVGDPASTAGRDTLLWKSACDAGCTL